MRQRVTVRVVPILALRGAGAARMACGVGSAASRTDAFYAAAALAALRPFKACTRALPFCTNASALASLTWAARSTTRTLARRRFSTAFILPIQACEPNDWSQCPAAVVIAHQPFMIHNHALAALTA